MTYRINCRRRGSELVRWIVPNAASARPSMRICITYLGMQILIEGLALAAFGTIHRTSSEPLLRQLIRYVMSDEARHVAFGVLSLQEAYRELSGPELRERQEFVYEGS